MQDFLLGHGLGVGFSLGFRQVSGSGMRVEKRLPTNPISAWQRFSAPARQDKGVSVESLIRSFRAQKSEPAPGPKDPHPA